jgi:hypothetical protein
VEVGLENRGGALEAAGLDGGGALSAVLAVSLALAFSRFFSRAPEYSARMASDLAR